MLTPRAPKEGLAITPCDRTVLVPSADVARLPADAVHQWVDAVGKKVNTTTAVDLWMQETIPGQPQWVIASRIIGDDRGVPVIAEVRVFPNNGSSEAEPGTWAAELAGSAARQI